MQVNAANAYEIIQASNQIVFLMDLSPSSEGVEGDQLKTVLSDLKQKGMLVSPGFKPALDLELTGSAQTDSETMLTMIRDGYKVSYQSVTVVHPMMKSDQKSRFQMSLCHSKNLKILRIQKTLEIIVRYLSFLNLT